jgi:hypothetical protein
VTRARAERENIEQKDNGPVKQNQTALSQDRAKFEQIYTIIRHNRTVSGFNKKTSNFDNITLLFHIIGKSLNKSLPHFNKIPQFFYFIRLSFNQ